MEKTKMKCILLHDRIGYALDINMVMPASDLLAIVDYFSSPDMLVPSKSMRLKAKDVLRGELLEAVPEANKPSDSKREAFVGIDGIIGIECCTEDVSRLSDEDANLLLAISVPELRYQTFMEKKRLDFGRQLSPGDAVFVSLAEFAENLPGAVRYKGELPPNHATMFGVELIVSSLFDFPREERSGVLFNLFGPYKLGYVKGFLSAGPFYRYRSHFDF